MLKRGLLQSGFAPFIVLILLLGMQGPSARADDGLDFTRATVVVRGKSAPLPERSAAVVLTEEVAKRANVQWGVATDWPKDGAVIVVTSGKGPKIQGKPIPSQAITTKPEGYGIATDASNAAQPVLWISGADPRGALFGVGRVLRALECFPSSVRLSEPLNLTSAPRYAIRGHQLGYRAQANSYDAWSVEQFDQYIRELAFFGTNSIEGIPFQDDKRQTVNPYPRAKMNVDISRICEKYGLDYWVWAPADFDLSNAKLRTDALAKYTQLFKDCPRMDAVFFPGGDPGNNPVSLVIPYLEDLAKALGKYHPGAKIWPSLQGFDGHEQDAFYNWLNKTQPKWIGGLTAGPSSPPMPETRERLPKQYGLRDYPDITHSVRCQFPVPWLDPAIAYTLGRECINPRPSFFAKIIRDVEPFGNGFISYSDGCHDDVNKIVWSALTWEPSADVTTVLTEYARVYFGADVAENAAAGILNLERDFEGSLAANGGVDAGFALWSGLEKQAPELKGNWRWQMCLLRAYYDMYLRHRLLYEAGLENEANAAMLTARTVGAGKAMDDALAILKRAESNRIRPELPKRVAELCDDLFKTIGLQTSVEKYKASDAQRGAVLDYVEYPLNNRWWLEDEIAKVRAMATEDEKCARLTTLATWENPGPGSYYDSVGNVAKTPHQVRGEELSGPILDMDHTPVPGFMWWDKGMRRVRQSWICGMDWPKALKYAGIDPSADYVIRTTGTRDCFVRVNGVRVAPTADGKEVGDVKEFPIPRRLYHTGEITLTFDPPFEPHLNWRVQSRLTEVWLIKK